MPDDEGLRERLAAEWRPVLGFEGLYEVSDHGRVRSLRRRNTRGGVLKPQVNNRGYENVVLHADGVGKQHRVHALVAAAWHGPRPEGQDCRHLNDDKRDNRPENLAWGSRSQNLMDAIRNGIHYLANRPHCGKGHEWTPDNTLWTQKPGKRPYRECRQCARLRDEARRNRTKARYGVTRLKPYHNITEESA